MVPELERSADLAEHVAQRTLQDLGGSITPRSRGLIQSMCDVGVRMWQLSSRAYAERSRDLSFEINEADDELDNMSAFFLAEGAAGGGRPEGRGGAGAHRPLLRADRGPRREPGQAVGRHGRAPADELHKVRVRRREQRGAIMWAPIGDVGRDR